MNKNNFVENELSLWKYFNEYAINKGYKVCTHNDSMMGRSTTAYTSDNFKPIMKFTLFGIPDLSYDFGIIVEDRNGNSILNGDTCGAYSLQASPNTDFEELQKRFKKMVKYVFSKYEVYSRENRLDFVFKGSKEERIKF